MKPEPAVRVSMLEDLGLISHCFPPAKPHMLWVRACPVIRVTLSSPPTAARSKSHTPETPPAAGGQLLQDRFNGAVGDGGRPGHPLRCWWLILRKLKTRLYKPTVITILEKVRCTPERYLSCASRSQGDVLGMLLCLRPPMANPSCMELF